MHYYKFNVADYRKDTAHLTPIEHYIYRSLIDWYYLDEMPIPKETQVVSRRLSLGKDDIVHLDNVLSDFFVLGDNGYVHGKIEDELSLYRQQAEKSRSNGKKGGRPRKTTATDNQAATQQEPKKTQQVISRNPDESKPNLNYKPLTNNHKPITILKDKTQEKTKRFVPPSYAEVFDYFSHNGLIDETESHAFVDYWESVGWMRGKAKMKSWQATARNWIKRKNEQGGHNGQHQKPVNQNQQRYSDRAAMVAAVAGRSQQSRIIDITPVESN